MIRITCTSCKNVLSIDDAFAGGVCRCQHCGTIQTVPAHLKGSADKAQPAETAGAGKSSKLLYRNEARGTAVGSGSGLDDLANLVASSGLSDPNLSKSRKLSGKTAGPERRTQTMMLLGAAGAVIVLLIVVVILLIFRGGKSNPSTGGDNTNDTSSNNPDAGLPPVPHTVAGPSFSTIKLEQNTIVYVIDNGQSSADLLDYVKAAVYHSVESLGNDRKFQILFWKPQSESYPAGSDTAFATADNIDAAKKKLEDTLASGQTDPDAALKTAVQSNPDAIVLITGKGDDLDKSLVNDVMAIRGQSPLKIHCVAINGAPADGVLAKIAKQTGGTFITMSDQDLKGLAD